MDIEQLRSHCLSRAAVEECFPFDEDTLVFKVSGKLFALCPLERSPLSVNLKCDPEYAIQLREEYPEVISPAYHMNKKHWNTVVLEGAMEESMYMRLIDHSYNLVVAGLPQYLRKQLEKSEIND